jgi:hypothetical protein
MSDPFLSCPIHKQDQFAVCSQFSSCENLTLSQNMPHSLLCYNHKRQHLPAPTHCTHTPTMLLTKTAL